MNEQSERLAKIKEQMEQIDTYYIQSKNTQGRDLLEELNDQCDIDWLIVQAERVEELEGNIKRHKDVNVELCKRIAELEMKYENTGSVFGRQNQRLLIEENTRLREALEFYADSMLNGSEARKALAGESK